MSAYAEVIFLSGCETQFGVDRSGYSVLTNLEEPNNRKVVSYPPTGSTP